jgi:hypothetical protein
MLRVRAPSSAATTTPQHTYIYCILLCNLSFSNHPPRSPFCPSNQRLECDHAMTSVN